MSTLSEREAMLRQALHAAVDGIQPHASGLERIQSRLRPPRPVGLAWADAVWTVARMRAPVALEAFLEWLRGVIALARERFGPRRGTVGGRASRTLSWLRPAAALGVTVFIVAAGAYVAFDAQQAIFPTGSNSTHSTGGGGAGGKSHGGLSGPSTRSHSSAGSVGSTRTKTGSGSCASTKPAGGSAPSTSTSGGQTQGSSPSASPSGTSSASPTPTVSDSSSPGGSATPTVGATNAAMTAAGATAAGPSLAKSAVLTRSSVASPTPTPTPCATKKPGRSPLGATLHPSAQPAVVSFGKLNDGR